jgi:hypothetical protein
MGMACATVDIAGAGGAHGAGAEEGIAGVAIGAPPEKPLKNALASRSIVAGSGAN